MFKIVMNNIDMRIIIGKEMSYLLRMDIYFCE